MQYLPKITIQRKLYAQLYRKIVHNRRINNYERGVRFKKKMQFHYYYHYEQLNQ